MQNFAVQKGMFGEIIETEFEKFKAYHGAKGSLMKKWDLAWHTWVLNWRKYNNGGGKKNGNQSVFDRVAEKFLRTVE